MQEALPYKTWSSSTATATAATTLQPSSGKDTSSVGVTVTDEKSVEKMVAENAVIVYGRRGCCMCHVIKHLLQGHGVNPTIFYVDEEDEAAILDQLSRIAGDGKDCRPQFPAIFVGGKSFGGLERVMGTHISGELVPILKEAGALWL